MFLYSDFLCSFQLSFTVLCTIALKILITFFSFISPPPLHFCGGGILRFLDLKIRGYPSLENFFDCYKILYSNIKPVGFYPNGSSPPHTHPQSQIGDREISVGGIVFNIFFLILVFPPIPPIGGGGGR